MRAGLIQRGWTEDEIFRDTESIAAGARWKSALRRALRQSEAVVFLASQASLDSVESRVETRVAEETGKPVFPLLIDDTPVDDPRLASFTEYQLIRLDGADPEDAAMARLLDGLAAIGLTPGRFVWQPEASGDVRNPYPGLRSFGESDAGVFFGRDADTARALVQVQALRAAGRGTLGIIGPSGAGKSSFLKAALWPRLRRDVRFVPIDVLRATDPGALGRNPLETDLAGAITATLGRLMPGGDGEAPLAVLLDRLVTWAAGGDGRSPAMPVIAIDQGEEWISAAPPGTDPVMEALRPHLSEDAARPGLVLLMTVRADSLDAMIAHWSGAALPPPVLMPLPPVQSAHYRDIILRPAEVARVQGVDLHVQETLAERLVAESDGADALPLLALTLRELYEWQSTRGETVLTLEAYQALGGLGGILAHQLAQVERVWGQPDFSQALRTLILPMLVHMDADRGQPRRRRVRHEALLYGERASLARLVSALLDARLLVRDGEHVEIAHDLLLRYPPVSTWIAEDRVILGWIQQLQQARVGYTDHRRGLLTGRELDIARGFFAQRADWLTPEDRAFVEDSLRADQDRRDAERQRKIDLDIAEAEAVKARTEAAHSRERAARRLAQRTMTGLVATLVLLGVAVYLGISADLEAQRADQAAEAARVNAADAEAAAQEANRQADIARGREMVARARVFFEQSAGRNGTAALIGAEALLLGAGEPAAELITDVLAVTPHKSDSMPQADGLINAPDGTRFYSWKTFGDGDTFGDGPSRGAAIALDLASGTVLARVEQQGWPRSALSPDGRWLAVGGEGRRLRVVDLTSGATVVDERRAGMTEVAFAPDGTALYVADSRGRFETRTGSTWGQVAVETLPLPGEGLHWGIDKGLELEVAPNGAVLLTMPHAIYLRPPGGAFAALGDIVESWANWAAFSPDGKTIAIRNSARDLQIRDAWDGRLLFRVDKVPWVTDIAFSPDGGQVASSRDDGRLDVHDIPSGDLVRTFDVATKSVSQIAYTNDSTLIAAVSDGTLRLLDIATGEERATWPARATRTSFLRDPLRDRMMFGDAQGIGAFADTEAVEELFVPDRAFGTEAEHLSADGSVLVIRELGTKNSGLWTEVTAHDAATGQVLWNNDQVGGLRDAVISPDGRTIATRTPKAPHPVTVWDTKTGQRHIHPDPTVNAIVGFSPDGNRIVLDADVARIVDLGSGAVLHDLGEPGGIDGIATSADGRVLYSFGSGQIRAWSMPGYRELWRSEGRWPGNLNRVAGGAGRYAHYGESAFGQVTAFETGATLLTLPLRHRASNLILSPDGGRLLIVSLSLTDPVTKDRYTEVELWDVDSQRAVLPPQRLTGMYWASESGFASDDLLLLTLIGHKGEDQGRTTLVLNPQTGQMLRAIDQPRGYSAAIQPIRHDLPLSYVTDRDARLIFPATGRQLTVPIPVSLHAVSQDGRTAVGRVIVNRHANAKRIAMIDLRTGDVLWQVAADPDAPIGRLSFTSDGAHVLAAATGAGPEGFARLFDAKDGTKTAELSNASAAEIILPMADPDLIFVRFWDESASVWRLSTGAPVQTFSHAARVGEVATARDAARLVTTLGTKLRIWDLDSGAALANHAAASSVDSLRIAPSGDLVVYRREAIDPVQSRIIGLWRPASGEPPQEILVPPQTGRLVLDRTGRHIAALVGKSIIQLWRTDTGASLGTVTARPGTRLSGEPVFDADTDMLMAYEFSNRDALSVQNGPRLRHLRAWRIPDLTEMARVETMFRHSDGPGTVRFSAQSRQAGKAVDLASSGPERIPLRDFKVNASGPHPDGAWISGWSDTAATAHNLVSGQRLHIPVDRFANDITADAFTPDMSAVFMAERRVVDNFYMPGAVRYRSVADGKPLAPAIEPGITVTRLAPTAGGVLMLGTAGGTASYGRYADARLWQPDTGAVIPLDVRARVGPIAVSPDGMLVAIGEGVHQQIEDRWQTIGEPVISLWDGKTGAAIGKLSLDAAPDHLAFSHDGRRLAVRDRDTVRVLPIDGQGRILRIDTAPDLRVADGGTLLARMEPGGYRAQVRLAGDGWVVANETDSLHLIWPETGETLILPHPGRDLARFVVSDDGTRIASLSGNRARVWRVPDGPETGATARDLLIGSVPAPQDGALLLTGENHVLFHVHEDRAVRLRYLPDTLIAEVCRRFSRGLMAAEIEHFLAGQEPGNPCKDKDDKR